MEIQRDLGKLKSIQHNLVEYLDSEDESEEKNIIFFHFLDDQNLEESQDAFKAFLHILLQISNDHHRLPSFYENILRIVIYYKSSIEKYFYSNYEKFIFFKTNKRILLFLIEEKIIKIDKYIASRILNNDFEQQNYEQYFFPELKTYMDEDYVEKYSDNLGENFEENRKIGENENYICQLIRKDLIDEFIIYVTKTNFQLNYKIKRSIFETNSFLIKNTPSLIEYSAFYGSLQIFKYLNFNNAILEPSILLYAIHSNNAELIHFIEELHLDFHKNFLIKCLKESIKCHHNAVACYVQDVYQINYDEVFKKCLKYFNFEYIDENHVSCIDCSLLYNLCKYDVYFIKFLIDDDNIDSGIKIKNVYY